MQVKAVPSTRRDELTGRLAVATLQLKKWFPGDVAVVLLVVPTLTRPAEATVTAFMKETAPDQQWGVLADDGTLLLEIPALGLHVRERPAPPTRLGRLPAPALFSDLNQWLLKVLLLRDAPREMWSGPREAVARPAELAAIADVSAPHVYRFLRLLKSHDFLRDHRGQPRIVRRMELFGQWSASLLRASQATIPVRSTLGPPSSIADLVTHLERETRYAVGGFEACKAFDLLHAPASTPEVYIDGARTPPLDRLLLEPCDRRDADLLLRFAPHTESIFRGRVRVGRIEVVDVLQAALDVSLHASRGHEQSRYILRDVLRWNDA